jgi:hypothetical protein
MNEWMVGHSRRVVIFFGPGRSFLSAGTGTHGRLNWSDNVELGYVSGGIGTVTSLQREKGGWV